MDRLLGVDDGVNETPDTPDSVNTELEGKIHSFHRSIIEGMKNAQKNVLQEPLDDLSDLKYVRD